MPDPIEVSHGDYISCLFVAEQDDNGDTIMSTRNLFTEKAVYNPIEGFSYTPNDADVLTSLATERLVDNYVHLPENLLVFNDSGVSFSGLQGVIIPSDDAEHENGVTLLETAQGSDQLLYSGQDGSLDWKALPQLFRPVADDNNPDTIVLEEYNWENEDYEDGVDSIQINHVDCSESVTVTQVSELDPNESNPIPLLGGVSGSHDGEDVVSFSGLGFTPSTGALEVKYDDGGSTASLNITQEVLDLMGNAGKTLTVTGYSGDVVNDLMNLDDVESKLAELSPGDRIVFVGDDYGSAVENQTLWFSANDSDVDKKSEIVFVVTAMQKCQTGNTSNDFTAFNMWISSINGAEMTTVMIRNFSVITYMNLNNEIIRTYTHHYLDNNSSGQYELHTLKLGTPKIETSINSFGGLTAIPKNTFVMVGFGDSTTITGNVSFTPYSKYVKDDNDEYHFIFTTGSTAPTITDWPVNNITWVGGSAPTMQANTTYEINILNGYGCYLEY